VPNTLDVAKQRKLIEDLRRSGQTTQDAETRLKDMLDFLRSARAYRGDTVNKLRQKSRHHRMDPPGA
jgi:DNA anti-recombination protein RmuC